MNIVGIDPGSDTVGYACITVDEKTLKIIKSETQLIHLSKTDSFKLKENKTLSKIHGERFIRLNILHHELTQNFLRDRMVSIATESPFFNPRRPSAFKPLVEAMFIIKQSLFQFDPNLNLNEIAPHQHKAFTKVKDKKDKEASRRALIILKDELNCKEDYLNKISEHEVDALAVAYTQTQIYLNSLKG